MLAPWVLEEIKTAKLNDERLNKRFMQLVHQLAQNPNLSIPAACGGAAETAAAYRWFDNDKIAFDNVLRPHIDATRQRIAAQTVVLLVQDTTEVDMTRPEQQVQGAGPLDGDSRRGVLLHVLHAFTEDSTPLGTIHASTIIRSDDKPVNATKSRAQRNATSIEEKESYRWIVALQQAHETAREQPEIQFVCLADSEGDIYELLAETQQAPGNSHWIVRACQDRALQRGPLGSDGSATHLRDQLLSAPVQYTGQIAVRGRRAKVACEYRSRRQPRESREAEIEVRVARVTLRPPYRPGHALPPVSVNAVLVRELTPPAGEPAVEWVLLTDLPIDSSEAIRAVVHKYTVRWTIEIFFRTLKSGCRIEDRRFEHIDRFLPCLALYLIVTWRTLYVCRLGRELPNVTCEIVFEQSEWKSVYRVVLGKSPRTPPKLQDMVRTVAQLGGYINRKRNDPPGSQTVWIGLQRLHDIAACWKLFGPGAKDRGRLV